MFNLAAIITSRRTTEVIETAPVIVIDEVVTETAAVIVIDEVVTETAAVIIIE